MLRQRFLETSRGRIAGLLQRGTRTVEALASELHLTPNAIRSQLAAMERDGLVKRAGLVPGTTRPSHTFELTPALEQRLSGAYIPLLTHVVRTFTEGLPRDQLNALMRQTGKRLANECAGDKRLTDDLHARVKAASEFLNTELGAVTHVVRKNGGFLLQGEGCPLAAITGKEPAVCLAVESLVREIVGAHVHECCDRGGRLRCCFEIHADVR
jgi:DeoR family transcriptional regulator, suf operon transcriptional repressor